MFENPKKPQQDTQIACDVAALLRDGVLIAVRRDDGKIGFVPSTIATDEQRAAALSPEAVIQSEALFDPNQN
jgi:hypothetical protein